MPVQRQHFWLAVSTVQRVVIFRPPPPPNETNEGIGGFQNVAPFFLNEIFPKNFVSPLNYLLPRRRGC